jgi:hypothetical protein
MLSQCRQSAKLFLQSSELGHHHPPPLPQASVSPPLWFRGGGEHTGGGSQFGRGEKHCSTLGLYVLCDVLLLCYEILS